jgi:hypothetical protein
MPLLPALSPILQSVTDGPIGRIAPMDGFSWDYLTLIITGFHPRIFYHNHTVSFTKFTGGTHGVDWTVLDKPQD